MTVPFLKLTSGVGQTDVFLVGKDCAKMLIVSGAFLFFVLFQVVAAAVLSVGFFPDWGKLTASVAAMFFLTTLIPLFYVRRVGGEFADVLFYNKERRDWVRAVVIGLAGVLLFFALIKVSMLLLPQAVVSAFFVRFSRDTSSKFLQLFEVLASGSWFAGVWAVLLMSLVSLTEEMVCRGVVLRHIEKKLNFIAALLISSALFGVVHFDPYKIIVSFVGGIIYGACFKVSGNIAAPVIAHAVFNLALLFFGDNLGRFLF